MPRLLLVDDNPSIHRIAESLLAPTDVELVCVASAAEALDRIGRGDRFDVALVDTAMPGMDGWTLLDRLRGMEETVRMPIALMAGVLDPVDPAKLAKASIQGFLKKPIELRELGDRVKALLVTPVVVSPSAVSTVPGTPATDLLKHAEEALPEFRPEHADVPTGLLDVDLGLPEPEDDLLVLTAEDVWPEEPVAAAPEPTQSMSAVPDMLLELEELDLDSLKDLAAESVGEPGPSAERSSEPAPEPAPTEWHQSPTHPVMEELETVPTDFIEPPLSPVLEPVTELADVLTHPEPVPELADVLTHPEPMPELADVFTHPEPVPELADVLTHQEPEVPAAAAVAGGQDAVAPGPATPVPAGPVPATSEQAQVLLQALLAEPVLMDALVKALVARLGDQVLREIAWEVMPDLAGRLQR